MQFLVSAEGADRHHSAVPEIIKFWPHPCRCAVSGLCLRVLTDIILQCPRSSNSGLTPADVQFLVSAEGADRESAAVPKTRPILKVTADTGAYKQGTSSPGKPRPSLKLATDTGGLYKQGSSSPSTPSGSKGGFKSKAAGAAQGANACMCMWTGLHEAARACKQDCLW